jgi:hypoxanthine-DNA glycosylase
MTLKRCFPPVVNADTRILILGSLPGEVSLAHGQYYANSQNRFWHLVGEVIETDLVAMSYPARLATLLEHRSAYGMSWLKRVVSAASIVAFAIMRATI